MWEVSRPSQPHVPESVDLFVAEPVPTWQSPQVTGPWEASGIIARPLPKNWPAEQTRCR
jgi:hypothetical protein